MDVFWATLPASIAREPSGPSPLSALMHFLFGTIFGWWILIILFLIVSSPVLRLLNLHRRRRQFIRAEGAKLANPQNAEARHKLASIFHDGRRTRKAETHVREAIRIAEESPLYEEVPHRFHVLLGDILYRRKRFDEAAEAYRKALEARSELGYGDVYLGLGRCAFRTGKPEEALDWFRKSMEERTSYLETYYRIAQASAALGQADGVAEARRRFRETASNLPRFARQPRFRWWLAFLTFPISRHLV